MPVTESELGAELTERDRELARLRSELAQAREKLRQSEEKAADLIRYAPSGIYEVDVRTGRFRSVNDAMCQILGYTREELLGMSAFALLDQAGRDLFADRIRRTLAGETVDMSVEYRVKTKDGRTIYAVLSTRLTYRDGQPDTAFVIAHDVTERRRADAEREAILAAIADGLLVVDAEGRIVHLNAAAQQMLGYSDDQLTLPIRERLTAFLHPLKPDGSPCAPDEFPVVRALRGEIAVNQEIILHVPARPGGHLRMAVSSAPILGPDGHVTGVVSTFTDVEPFYAVSQELRQANSLLQTQAAKLRLLFDSIDEGFCVIKVLFDENQRPVDYVFLEANPAFELQTGLHDAVGRRVRDLVPEHEEHWFEIYGKIALTGEAARFENSADQLGRFYDVYAFRTGEPAERNVAVLFKDIAERKRREQNAAFLAEVGGEFARLSSPDEILAAVGEKVSRYFGAARLTLADVDDDRDLVTVVYDSREPALARRLGTQRLSDYTSEEWRRLQRAGQVLAVDDVTTDPRTAAYARNYPQWKVRSHVIACFAREGKLRFLVALQRGEPHHWRADEIELLQALAERIYRRIERARADDAMRQARDELEQRVRERTAELATSREQLREYARRLVEATENERRNLARELHDQAGQSLSALKLTLAQLRREADAAGRQSASFDDMGRLVEGVMDDLHRLAMNLRPVSLDRYGLTVALEQYAEFFRQQSGIDVDLVTVGIEEERLPREMETAIYRVVQEALTNVLRHSEARRVGVMIDRREERVLAIVEDDGRGFDVDAALSCGRLGRLGLLGMRERAEMLGGRLTIESSPGQGTAVYVEVPLSASSSGGPA